MQLNPYNEEKCKEIVEIFNQPIKNKYGHFILNNFCKYYEINNEMQYRSTPRFSIINNASVIPCASFYYLNKLLEISPTEIADIGCGMNFFKNIIPGIIGVDGKGEWADVNEFFNNNFINKPINFFQCAFSINSLHFIPLIDFYKRVMDFTNIIKPGGRGYIAMNVARMVENTDKTILKEMFSTEIPNNEQLLYYITQKIKALSLKFLIIDILIIEKYDEPVDGNIRLVFEK